MTGIYLKCDKCGKTLGGEDVTNAERGLRWSQTETLKRAAIELGWTGDLSRQSTNDLCPECAREAPSNLSGEPLPTTDKETKK